MSLKSNKEVVTEIIDAIDAEAFEKAIDLIAGLNNKVTAEELASLCFHDYLWLNRPSKTEAQIFIDRSHPSLKRIFNNLYDSHVQFMAVLRGGEVS